MTSYNALVERNEMLEESAHANIENQRDFLHGVAHEFRAPLARLRFAVDLEDIDAEGRVGNIIDDMDDLVTEILQYSRYRHGLFDVDISTVDLTNILRSISENLIEGREIALKFGPGMASAKPIQTDLGLIERCITNLLLNAVRFANKAIFIDVDAGADWTKIVVEDDGPGVPPGKRELIFEAFTRLDPSRARTSGGTGLGLAIVAGIVDKLDGSVAVEDADLGGARFTIGLRT